MYELTAEHVETQTISGAQQTEASGTPSLTPSRWSEENLGTYARFHKRLAPMQVLIVRIADEENSDYEMQVVQEPEQDDEGTPESNPTDGPEFRIVGSLSPSEDVTLSK